MSNFGKHLLNVKIKYTFRLKASDSYMVWELNTDFPYSECESSKDSVVSLLK
jgi:hypothetical protein